MGNYPSTSAAAPAPNKTRLLAKDWKPLYEDACVKSTDPDYCYHFYSETVHQSTRPVLCKHDPETQKPYQVDRPSGGPIIRIHSYQELNEKCPLAPHTPIFPYRHDIITNILPDLEKTVASVQSLCCADCWGVYVRNAKTHQITQMLYNFRIHKELEPNAKPRPEVEKTYPLPEDWPEPRHPYWPSDTKVSEERDKLSNDDAYLANILRNLGEEEELVVVLNYQFKEVIFRPISPDQKFMEITLHHHAQVYRFLP